MALKVSELTRQKEVLADQLKDPAFREEWERTALARAVAVRVAEYRAEHRLTQAQLAKLLGMHQSAVARLEAGEHNPSMDTLYLLSGRLGIEFVVDVAPATRRPSLLPRGAAKATEAVERFTAASGSHVLVAAR